MKRLLCLLLGTVLLFAFCACASAENGDASDASDASAQESEMLAENERVSKIRSFLNGNVPDRTLKANNPLATVAYTFSEEPDPAYPDPDHKKLRDGLSRDLFDQHFWVGFKIRSTLNVEYDFGPAGGTFADLEVDCLRQTDYGIELPETVSVFVSQDGNEYTQIACLYKPSDLPKSSKYSYRFAFPEEVHARYLRIALRSGGSFLFIGEIAGYRYSENGTIDVSAGQTVADADLEYDFYDYTLPSETTVPVSESDADYHARQNLALQSGVTVQAQHFDPMNKEFCKNNTPKEHLSRLTDGKKASSASYSDPAFVQFYRGYGRHIVIDLGNRMAVEELTVQFLNAVDVGVGTPPDVMISASDDGNTWYTVYADSTGVYGDPQTRLIELRAPLRQTTACRYVRVSFLTVPNNGTSCAVYVSEIEVYGTKDTTNASALREDPTIRKGRYPQREECGCENILFAAIHDTNGRKEAARLDETNALRFLACLDRDGNPTDTFFDALCFSPDSRFARAQDAKESADTYLDLCFAEECNLIAVERAAETVAQSLQTEQKTGIWFSFICPRSQETCSDVNGDGKSEDLSTVEGRVAYLKYQVDRACARFRAAGYTHLELLGFYWNDEVISYAEFAVDSETIRQINAYLHSLGLRSFWCPYYNAYGFWMWEELGFDFAVLQPNYMFYATESTRLATAAETARICGMGVELEIEEYENKDSVDLYRSYLRQGVLSGYVNGVKLFYQGFAVGAIANGYASASEHANSVYYDSYRYAKGLLDESYGLKQPMDLSSFTDQKIEVPLGKRVRFSIGDTTDLHVRFLQSSVFGSVRLDQSGNGFYSSGNGYHGAETLVLELSDDVGNRKTVTLTVQISP